MNIVEKTMLENYKVIPIEGIEGIRKIGINDNDMIEWVDIKLDVNLMYRICLTHNLNGYLSEVISYYERKYLDYKYNDNVKYKMIYIEDLNEYVANLFDIDEPGDIDINTHFVTDEMLDYDGFIDMINEWLDELEKTLKDHLYIEKEEAKLRGEYNE